MLRQHIAAIEATPGAPSNNHLTPLVYFENLVTSLYALFSSHVSNPVAQSTRYFLGEKLNGQNYFSWSQSIKTILEGTTSLVSWPGRYLVLYLYWETLRNDTGNGRTLIRSTLIDSMEPWIGKPLLYAATVNDIWDMAQQLYSKRQNDSRLYPLQK